MEFFREFSIRWIQTSRFSNPEICKLENIQIRRSVDFRTYRFRILLIFVCSLEAEESLRDLAILWFLFFRLVTNEKKKIEDSCYMISTINGILLIYKMTQIRLKISAMRPKVVPYVYLYVRFLLNTLNITFTFIVSTEYTKFIWIRLFVHWHSSLGRK